MVLLLSRTSFESKLTEQKKKVHKSAEARQLGRSKLIYELVWDAMCFTMQRQLTHYVAFVRRRNQLYNSKHCLMLGGV